MFKQSCILTVLDWAQLYYPKLEKHQRGCTAFPADAKPKISSDSVQLMYVLLRDSSCSDVTKVRNAMNAGAGKTKTFHIRISSHHFVFMYALVLLVPFVRHFSVLMFNVHVVLQVPLFSLTRARPCCRHPMMVVGARLRLVPWSFVVVMA